MRGWLISLVSLLLAVTGPIYPHPATTQGNGTHLYWKSPTAPLQFLICIVLIGLVWAFWFSCRKKDDGQ